MSAKFTPWVSVIAWIVALGSLGFAIYLGVRSRLTVQLALSQKAAAQVSAERDVSGTERVNLPQFVLTLNKASVRRKILLRTSLPQRPSTEIKTYVVKQGDSLFGIAQEFRIKPETLLWANYDLLNDNPDLLTVGMELKIPPVDGVYYQWQAGDTVESVAVRFEAKVQDVLSWSGNPFDLTNPTLESGTWIMVPGGHREFRQWVIPVIPRGRAGVSKSVYGAGACEGGYEGAYGSGSFIWPSGNHYLSGNDYWSGHLGIDLAAGEGAPIYASDSGVIVFSGWATGGYGYTIVIDHGNGYQTLYAHLSGINATCGRSVGQGQVIGYAGSTGNSTGAHLHFEVRYQGGFVSPWYVLPAP